MASRRGLSCPVPACRPKNKTSLRERAAQAFCCGTGGGTRTHIPVRIPDFESSASANSATPASGFERNVYRSIALVKRDAPLFFSLPSLPSLLFFFFLFVTLVSLVTFFLFVPLVSLVTFSFRFSRHSRFSRCFFLFVALVTYFRFFCPTARAPSGQAPRRFAVGRRAPGQRLASLRGAGLFERSRSGVP